MSRTQKFLYAPFQLLQDTWEKFFLVGVCAIFSILFINLYTPFNIDQWKADHGFSQFLRLSGFGIIGGAFLALSQLLVKPLLVKGNTTWIQFIYWTLSEILVLSLIFHRLYGNNDSSFFLEYLTSLKYTFLGLLIPYTLALCFIWIFKKQQEDQHKPKITDLSNKLLSLRDEYGNSRLSLKSGNILFIEAADNYSTIFYKDNGTVKKEMIRNSLKGLSEQLKDWPIRRCHRSYLVNVQNVKMARKSSGKFTLLLENSTSVIPVSRKFTPEFNHLLA